MASSAFARSITPDLATHTPPNPWRLCVAPMLDWTDRHCRFFHRLLAPQARLYTEMVHANAIRHGHVARLLDYAKQEHPLALQLGGGEPVELAQAVRLAVPWGYDEINLNVGCPSERVQSGAFGACLMAEPTRVRDCVAAMREATTVPVTVKHRLGLDHVESYALLCDFVGTVAAGGCTTFVVHARNAWLQGLSPAQNREVPPLRHDWVWQLKRDFPQLVIVINGGISSVEAAKQHLQHVDGVMLGRAAYHEPLLLAQLQTELFANTPSASSAPPTLSPPPGSPAWYAALEAQLAHYSAQQALPSSANLSRHLLGLHKGEPGARAWRRVMTQTHWQGHALAQQFEQAREAMSERV